MSDPLGKEPRSYEVDHTLVNDMANHMFEKIRKTKQKAHWSTVTQTWLLKRLKEEFAELEDALILGSDNLIEECADVANFAAMIADNHKKGKE